jgi:hypothetical protein
MARLAAAAPCASCAFSVAASKHLSYASGEHLKRVRAQYRVDRATIAHRFGVAAAAAAADRVYCYVLSHALQLSALERPELAPFPDVLAPFPNDYAVVPGFDLFGHSMRDNTVTSLENGHWTVRTRLAYSAGTPVTIRYGSLANVQLLMQHGFVLDANPYDVLHLTVAPFPQDVNAAFKQKLMDERFGAFTERRFARGGAVGVNRTAVPAGLSAPALAFAAARRAAARAGQFNHRWPHLQRPAGRAPAVRGQRAAGALPRLRGAGAGQSARRPTPRRSATTPRQWRRSKCASKSLTSPSSASAAPTAPCWRFR